LIAFQELQELCVPQGLLEEYTLGHEEDFVPPARMLDNHQTDGSLEQKSKNRYRSVKDYVIFDNSQKKF
jgi:hypothetical protein